MSVIVLLTLKAKPDCYDELGSTLKNILIDTSAFEGCEGLYAAGDPKNHSFLLCELWGSIENQQAYMKWRQERGDLDVLGAMLREPPLLETRDFIFSSQT